jgi:hypothetical protein
VGRSVTAALAPDEQVLYRASTLSSARSHSEGQNGRILKSRQHPTGPRASGRNIDVYTTLLEGTWARRTQCENSRDSCWFSEQR